MAIKVGINGFGRIGRLVLRNIIERPETINNSSINHHKANVKYMIKINKNQSIFHGLYDQVRFRVPSVHRHGGA